MKNIRAAWVINGKIRSGSSHEMILRDVKEDIDLDTVKHGYIDEIGRFFGSIEEIMNLTETLLVRHAQTFFNMKQNEDLDSDLTPHGERQATQLGQHMGKMDLNGYCGYVSPALRTLKTARRIYERTGIRFKVTPFVYEFRGPWRALDRSLRDYVIMVPNRQKEFPEFDWSEYPEQVTFTPETLEDFIKRMAGFIQSDLPNKRCVVAHGAVVWTMVDLLTSGKFLKGHDSDPVKNASISLVRGSEPVYLFHPAGGV